MDCENAPAPSFVRTESPTPASSLDDHATASCSPRGGPSHSESHRDNLFLEGDPDRQPAPSPESRPPADDPPARGHRPVVPLGGSSWSATAAAHRPDAAKFTRAPDSVARRLLSTRPPHVSARLAFSGAAASVAIAIIAFIASVGAPGWLPLIGVSANGVHTLTPRASTGYRSPTPSSENASGLDPRRPNPHLAAALRPTPKSTFRLPAHRRASHTTLFVGRRAASPARYVPSQSPNASSSSAAPASQSTYTPPPASSRSYTPPATRPPAVAPTTHSSPSAPSTSSSQTASAKPKQAGPTGPVSLIGAGTSPSS